MTRFFLALLMLALSSLAVAMPRLPLPALDRSAPGGTALIYRTDAAGEHFELLHAIRLPSVPPGRALPSALAHAPRLRLPATPKAPTYEYPLDWPAMRRIEWADDHGRLQKRLAPIDERFVLVRVPGTPKVPVPFTKSSESFDVTIILESGPSENHLDLVILGDGYTASEQEDFLRHAEELVEGLFAAEPFQSRRGSFNVHAVHVISNESGVSKEDADTDADCATARVEVDTALDCSFCVWGIQRAVACNEVRFLQIMPVAVPQFDFGVVLVNSERPGGTGGLVPAFTRGEYFGAVVRHELGHYLGALGDEYEDCLPWSGVWPPAPNLTEETDRSAVPWVDLIAPETPVPTFRHLNCNGVSAGDCGRDLNGRANFCLDTEGTPVDVNDWEAHSGAVGLFEGGRYQYTGVFRPTASCTMRTLDADFCPVCARELVRWIEYFAPPPEPPEEPCEGRDVCGGDVHEGDAGSAPDVTPGPPDTIVGPGDVPREVGGPDDDGAAAPGAPDVPAAADVAAPVDSGRGSSGGGGGCRTGAAASGGPVLGLFTLLLVGILARRRRFCARIAGL